MRPGMIALTVVVALLGGCSMDPGLITTVPTEDIPRIQSGMTLEDLRGELQGKTYWQYLASHGGDSRARFMASVERTPTHEITITRDGDSVVCVSARVIQPEILFILVNDRLVQMRPGSGPVRRPLLERLLQKDSLTTHELVDYVKTTTERRNRLREKYAEPPPIPFFLVPRMTSDERARERRRAALLEKYDPFQVRIGMSPEEVQEVLGDEVSRLVRESDREVVRFYGEPLSESEAFWPFVAVTFEDELVIAVLSQCALLGETRRRTYPE